MTKYNQLTSDERFLIEKLYNREYSPRQISELLNRSPSTIYRELNRNKESDGYYSAGIAHLKALQRKNHLSESRKFNATMRAYIDIKITRKQWSPEQISGYCKTHDIAMVSHETIYQYIYSKQGQRKKLYEHLRRKQKTRQNRSNTYDRRGIIPNRVSIDQRPEEVDRRQRIGDWEADTIFGRLHRSALLTQTDRATGFTLINNMKRKDAPTTSKTMIKSLNKYRKWNHTITVDNGKEFSEHEKITKQTKSQVYFAHPYAPYERGTNENTNGLIRQYWPKGTDFSTISDEEVFQVQQKLNQRPRKRLNFKSPETVFKEMQSAVALDT